MVVSPPPGRPHVSTPPSRPFAGGDPFSRTSPHGDGVSKAGPRPSVPWVEAGETTFGRSSIANTRRPPVVRPSRRRRVGVAPLSGGPGPLPAAAAIRTGQPSGGRAWPLEWNRRVEPSSGTVQRNGWVPPSRPSIRLVRRTPQVEDQHARPGRAAGPLGDAWRPESPGRNEWGETDRTRASHHIRSNQGYRCPEPPPAQVRGRRVGVSRRENGTATSGRGCPGLRPSRRSVLSEGHREPLRRCPDARRRRNPSFGFARVRPSFAPAPTATVQSTSPGGRRPRVTALFRRPLALTVGQLGDQRPSFLGWGGRRRAPQSVASSRPPAPA